MFKDFFFKFFSTVFALFYPPHCYGCEKYLLEEKYLCHDCWSKLELLSGYHCPICSHQLNLPLLAIERFHCPNCADQEFSFNTAVSSFRYNGLVRTLIFQFKYGRDQSLKKLLGHLLAVALKDERLQGISFSAIVPVPLYFSREREREFNQARLLADEVAQQLNLPVNELLKRIKPTSMQARSSRQERIENLQGAFSMKQARSCPGNYLLVDDVFTTGSTVNECAKVLLEGGAAGVWVIAAARG